MVDILIVIDDVELYSVEKTWVVSAANKNNPSIKASTPIWRIKDASFVRSVSLSWASWSSLSNTNLSKEVLGFNSRALMLLSVEYARKIEAKNNNPCVDQGTTILDVLL